jgi:hypothetical protein
VMKCPNEVILLLAWNKSCTPKEFFLLRESERNLILS